MPYVQVEYSTPPQGPVPVRGEGPRQGILSYHTPGYSHSS